MLPNNDNSNASANTLDVWIALLKPDVAPSRTVASFVYVDDGTSARTPGLWLKCGQLLRDQGVCIPMLETALVTLRILGCRYLSIIIYAACLA